MSDPRQPGPRRASLWIKLVEVPHRGEESFLDRIRNGVRVRSVDPRDVPPHTHAVLVIQSGSGIAAGVRDAV